MQVSVFPGYDQLCVLFAEMDATLFSFYGNVLVVCVEVTIVLVMVIWLPLLVCLFGIAVFYSSACVT